MNNPLKVFTMNIWNFSEPYEARQKLIRKEIEALRPDVLSFQEAGFTSEHHQVSELLEGTDYQIIHHFDHVSDRSLYGNCGSCIASRWPMELVEVLPYQLTPHSSKNLQLVAMAAKIKAPQPLGEFLLVNPITSWEQNREYERELQVVATAKMIQRHADPKSFPTIIAGDFTSAPDTACIRFLAGKQSLGEMSVFYLDAWEEGGDGTPGYTWSYQNDYAKDLHVRLLRQKNHARRIDYIFLGCAHDYEKGAIVRNCKVVLDAPQNGVWASDHYGVYAEIDVVDED